MLDMINNPDENKSKILYGGNLPFKSSPDDIRAVFAEYGTVYSIKLIKDRLTGRPRGFGFIKMDPEGASRAQTELNNKEFGGRKLRIEEAKDQSVPTKRKTPRKIREEGNS